MEFKKEAVFLGQWFRTVGERRNSVAKSCELNHLKAIAFDQGGNILLIKNSQVTRKSPLTRGRSQAMYNVKVCALIVLEVAHPRPWNGEVPGYPPRVRGAEG